MSLKTFIALLLVLSCWLSPVWAQDALAPVEARVPFAPSPFVGSDGLTHLAYELHVSNFYGDTGPLKPQSLKVFADDASTPLLALSAGDLTRMVGSTPAADAAVSKIEEHTSELQSPC